jgi:quinol monooxygenase YgiN
MILEIAQIDIKPGMEAEFESGVAKAAPVFRRAKGCTNHTVDFRGSPDFAEWRKLVGHCFASPPEVEHVHEVVKGF